MPKLQYRFKRLEKRFPVGNVTMTHVVYRAMPPATLICTTTNEKDAQIICDALNAQPPKAAKKNRYKKPTDEPCKCVIAEKPVRPCNALCWHFSTDTKAVCVNCGNTGKQKPAEE